MCSAAIRRNRTSNEEIIFVDKKMEYMSQEGYDELVAELEHLEKVELPLRQGLTTSFSLVSM